MRRILIPIIALSLIIAIAFFPNNNNGSSISTQPDSVTDPVRIESYMQQQLDLGFRIPGSPGSYAFAEWIYEKIDQFPDYSIKNHTFVYKTVELRNFLITSSDDMPKYLLGAHYDSRARASADPNETRRDDPVPGANDAASGVAAILEMLHFIPTQYASEIGFVLFDGEDQGSNGMVDEDGISWNWIRGSTQFVADLTETEITAIESFILFDMIADDELVLKQERRSDDSLTAEFWTVADELGYSDIFVDQLGYTITDDHVPFINAGIPSLDLIDLDYPEWHTVSDDMDHVSPDNVGKVVNVALSWFEQKVETDFLSTPSSVSSNAMSNSSTTPMENSSPESDDPTESPISMSSVWIAILIPTLIKYKMSLKKSQTR